jgi:Fe-S-cluster containining protein
MPGDRDLIQIVDAALAESARQSGAWLACRPGCAECCIGPFPITQLDARRLREGLRELSSRDPERAARVRERARVSVARILPDFPGDPATGILAEGDAAEERFATLADDEPCPALDPATRTCDLYAARPITCRTFGPSVRYGDESLSICELCYRGATDAEIAACEVEIDPGRLECDLLEDLEEATGERGRTLVAFALAPPAEPGTEGTTP